MPFHSENDGLRDHEFSQLAHDPTMLTAPMRRVVRDSIVERCTFMHTPLVALNVRPTHIHLIVKAEDEPGKVMGGFKSRSTRALRDQALVAPTHHVWTDRGSKRWLWTLDALREAMEYVLLEQGSVDEFAVRGDGY
jgi:REP element-mobilizing transposase RayT